MMKNYVFSEHLILRIPMHTCSVNCHDVQYFLDLFVFRSALYLASPGFYKVLEEYQFKTEGLTPKVLLTLKKYINRFCYRPIPFGLFATVSHAQWSADCTNTSITIKPANANLLFSQQLISETSAQKSNAAATQANFFLNHTIYRSGSEYRYIKSGLNQEGTIRRSRLQSLPVNKVLTQLFQHCPFPQSKDRIIAIVKDTAGCSREEAADYINFLFQEQFLISEYEPNITGEDYLHRISRIEGAVIPVPDLPKKIDVSSLNKEYLDSIAATMLTDSAEPDLHSKELFNVIAVRELEHNKLPDSLKAEIKDGLFALSRLSQPLPLPQMEKFVKEFGSKFDQQTVPLLNALDPETGIDYNFIPEPEQNDLLETIQINNKPKKNTSISWTPQHALLLRKWLDQSYDSRKGIILTDEDLNAPEGKAIDLQGMAVLFRLTGDKVFLENAGGINAPALAGRFSVADQKIHEAAADMAKYIENLNPEVIFAELLHLTDPRTDNVNRRESFYAYDLPLTAISTKAPTHQLRLSELSVKVHDGKVYLWSDRLHKIVIPRLSSAYNHARDNLPLFRFLADLSYQYSDFNLSFDLPGFFPGQKKYPRVTYKRVILSLASWTLEPVAFKDDPKNDQATRYKNFMAMAEKEGLPESFSLTERDQQLVFNSGVPQDVLLFLDCVKEKEKVIIEEFITDAANFINCSDQKERPYIVQFNAFLLPGDPYHIPDLGAKSKSTKPVQRQLIPGSEWLYLKLYSSTIGVNRLLLDIFPLLKKKYSNGKVLQWFFIRYEDHAPHIRLRLQINPADIAEVLAAFKRKLLMPVEQQIVREYQIDTYTREIERYAAAGILHTEALFCASSAYTMYYLSAASDNRLQPFQFALKSMADMLDQYFKLERDRIEYLHVIYRNFEQEFGDPDVKVSLDKKFRELRGKIKEIWQDEQILAHPPLVKARNNFLAATRHTALHLPNDIAENYGYISSVIHMHLNRIFVTEPRKQEMICYYLLYKHLKSESARRR